MKWKWLPTRWFWRGPWPWVIGAALLAAFVLLRWKEESERVVVAAVARVAGDYEAVVAFYEGVGQRPIAAVLPDSAEGAMFRSHGWVLDSHDADTVFDGAAGHYRGHGAVRCRSARRPHGSSAARHAPQRPR